MFGLVIPSWVTAALAAVATALLCLFLHNARVDQLQLDWNDLLTAELASQKAKFDDANAKQERRNNDLQNNYDDIDRQLSALILRKPAKCVPVYIAGAECAVAARQSVEALGGNAAGITGVTDTYLYGFAARCERVVADFNYCRRSLEDVYEDAVK